MPVTRRLARTFTIGLKRAPTDSREVRAALDIAIGRNALFKVLFPRGDALQADGARIGVQARILSCEWGEWGERGEYRKRANPGEHQVDMSGWSTNVAVADEFLTPTQTCRASRGGIQFCHAEFDRLVEAARAEVDRPKRLALIEPAQQIFKRRRPRITMAHRAVHIPLRKDVQGFVMSPTGSVDFDGVWRE